MASNGNGAVAMLSEPRSHNYMHTFMCSFSIYKLAKNACINSMQNNVLFCATKLVLLKLIVCITFRMNFLVLCKIWEAAKNKNKKFISFRKILLWIFFSFYIYIQWMRDNQRFWKNMGVNVVTKFRDLNGITISPPNGIQYTKLSLIANK